MKIRDKSSNILATFTQMTGTTPDFVNLNINPNLVNMLNNVANKIKYGIGDIKAGSISSKKISELLTREREKQSMVHEFQHALDAFRSGYKKDFLDLGFHWILLS